MRVIKRKGENLSRYVTKEQDEYREKADKMMRYEGGFIEEMGH